VHNIERRWYWRVDRFCF